MNSKSRTRIKHTVLLLVALAGLSFSLAAAAENGKIEILSLGQAATRIHYGTNPLMKGTAEECLKSGRPGLSL